MGSKIAFVTEGGTICVVSAHKTANAKIAGKNEMVVQTYHYSIEQYVAAQGSVGMREFFSKDGAVCMDCPYAMGNGAELKGCYTHKFRQFISMSQHLKKVEHIHELTEDVMDRVVEMCRGRYIRFGAYGEPVLIPYKLVERMVNVAKSWTGYTHQWSKPDRYDYRRFFMASTHNDDETAFAGVIGWRAFMEHDDKLPRKGMIHCPASKEKDMASNCAKCGLCSGTDGKGTKHVHIFNHS